MVKCLAQGHKRRNRQGRDSNSHSDNTRTSIQCMRPLGHGTPHAGEQTNEVICWQHLWIKSIKSWDFSKLLQKDMVLH